MIRAVIRSTDSNQDGRSPVLNQPSPATPHLEENIRSICKELKPGGRLILLEVINPDDIATNFMA